MNGSTLGTSKKVHGFNFPDALSSKEVCRRILRYAPMFGVNPSEIYVRLKK